MGFGALGRSTGAPATFPALLNRPSCVFFRKAGFRVYAAILSLLTHWLMFFSRIRVGQNCNEFAVLLPLWGWAVCSQPIKDLLQDSAATL